VTVDFHLEAEQELLQSVSYYEERAEGLGTKFLDEVLDTLILVKSFPGAGSFITDSDQRILLNKFPYGVIYSIKDDYIQIKALMHLRRKPDHWKSRF
jgi:hypothetical protein